MSTAEGEHTQAGALSRAQRAFAATGRAFGFSDTRQFNVELMIFAGVLVAAGAWGAFLFSHFEFERLCRGFDLWFDSDPGRTVANITSRWTDFHDRSVLHPLYSLLIAGPFGMLQTALGLPTSTVVALYVSAQSACYSGAAYAAMRGLGLLRVDAVLGLLLLNSTAAAIYWIGFPEWIAFGATTVIISVAWVAAPASLRNRATGVAQNMLSGSIGLTNWVIGAAASWISDWPKLRWGQAFSQTRDALALMAALAVVQYFLFPTTSGFLDIRRDVGVFFYPYGAERTLFDYAVEFLAQSLVAPQPGSGVVDWSQTPAWGVLIMTGQLQGVPVTPLTIVIFALWLALCALSVRAVLQGKVRGASVVIVVGALVYLFTLHVAVGGEFFLFSLHFAPLLLFIALWSLRAEGKWLARGICSLLIVASFSHNYPSFRDATAFHNAIDASWLIRPNQPALVNTVQETDCR